LTAALGTSLSPLSQLVRDLLALLSITVVVLIGSGPPLAGIGPVARIAVDPFGCLGDLEHKLHGESAECAAAAKCKPGTIVLPIEDWANVSPA
jgi:hypothetical protein